MIPRCLGPKELHMMQMFVSGRLASSSGIVRRQVTEGLVPLFLVASDPSQISLSGNPSWFDHDNTSTSTSKYES